jgi:hypothetical protein
MRTDGFLWSFTQNWLAAMSGAASVPLAIAAFFVTNDVAKTGLWITSSVCLLAAAYGIWKIERQHLNEARAEIAKLQAQIMWLNSPQFSLDIVYAMAGDDPGVNGSHIVLVLKLQNHGSPAAALPSAWALDIRFQDGSIASGTPARIAEVTKLATKGDIGRVFLAQDWILNKASNGIERLGQVEGILMFLLPNLSYTKLMTQSTAITVSGMAAGGHMFSRETSIQWLRNKSDAVCFSTAVKFPYDVKLSEF